MTRAMATRGEPEQRHERDRGRGEYLPEKRECLKLGRADARSSVDRVAGVAAGEVLRMGTRR